MARKGIASDFRSQTTQYDKFKVYVDLLPVGHWLLVFLDNNSIVVDDDIALGVEAIAFDDAKNLDKAIAMNSIERRNALANPIFSSMKEGFQVIKAGTPGVYDNVRLFSGIITDNGRFIYPTSFPDLSLLWGKYYHKNGTYALGLSPAYPYYHENDINISLQNDDVILAMIADNNADINTTNSEDNTEQRNEKWSGPLENLVKIYNFCKAVLIKTPRKLGLMGFEIIETPPGHKLQKSTALQEEHRLIHGAIIGSIITNLNDFEILIYPGPDMLKVPHILKAGEVMAVKKGMSEFILYNPNPLELAKISVTVRKA